MNIEILAGKVIIKRHKLHIYTKYVNTANVSQIISLTFGDLIMLENILNLDNNGTSIIITKVRNQMIRKLSRLTYLLTFICSLYLTIISK